MSIASGTRLRELRRLLREWTPSRGFKQTNLRFTTADIMFGGRIARLIQNTPEHRRNYGKIVARVKEHMHQDQKFESWIRRISIDKLQNVIEFSYFPTPPKR